MVLFFYDHNIKDLIALNDGLVPDLCYVMCEFYEISLTINVGNGGSHIR